MDSNTTEPARPAIPEQHTWHADLGLIWGAGNIAKVIGRTRRQTFGLLEAGELPAVKIGGRWAATIDALRRRFQGGRDG